MVVVREKADGRPGVGESKKIKVIRRVRTTHHLKHSEQRAHKPDC